MNDSRFFLKSKIRAIKKFKNRKTKNRFTFLVLLTFSSLLLSDIAATSVEQCEARYKEMLERARRERGSHRTFQAEFITADCSKVPSLQLQYNKRFSYVLFYFFACAAS